MATSSTFDTSNSYIKYNITVNINSQSITNNTSNITVTVRFWRTNSYETYGSGNCYCEINGTTYSSTVTPSQKITSSGINLFSQTMDISHNNDGSKSIWVGAKIDINAPLSSNLQGFTVTLPTIPRAATFSNADNFNDTDNPKIYFNNPAGFKLQLKMEAGGNDHLVVRDNLYTSSPYTFSLAETERNSLKALCPNSNTLTVRFTVATYMPGSSSPDNWSYGDRTMTITNANPVFNSNQLNYIDSNSSIVDITGNDQLIVRNKSNLQITFTAATPQKSSTISKYQTIFNGVTTDKTSAGTYSLGIVNSAQNLNLQVKVIDSRGNSTTISKIVTILDWVPPIINASAIRVNNFENQTNLLANVQISSVNELNILESLQYRIKKNSEVDWNPWIDFQNNVQTLINLDNLFAWDLQVQATDKFDSNIQNLVIPKGMPIAFIDTKKLSIGINCFPEKSSSLEINGKTISDIIWPIGSIYMSVSSINPSAFFGGNWVKWGSGRVVVGVDTNQSEFNIVEKTGGSKYLQSHGHTVNFDFTWDSNHNHADRTDIFAEGISSNRHGNYLTGGAVKSSGSGDSQNLQPYITSYMWKRTA